MLGWQLYVGVAVVLPPLEPPPVPGWQYDCHPNETSRLLHFLPQITWLRVTAFRGITYVVPSLVPALIRLPPQNRGHGMWYDSAVHRAVI